MSSLADRQLESADRLAGVVDEYLKIAPKNCKSYRAVRANLIVAFNHYLALREQANLPEETTPSCTCIK